MDSIVPPPLGVHTRGDGKKFLKGALRSANHAKPPWHGEGSRFDPGRAHREQAPNQHKRLGLLATGEVQEVVPGSGFDVAFPRFCHGRDLVRQRDCQPTFLDHD